jgi:hypothetical protein
VGLKRSDGKSHYSGGISKDNDGIKLKKALNAGRRLNMTAACPDLEQLLNLAQRAFEQLNHLWYELHEIAGRPEKTGEHALFTHIERAEQLVRRIGVMMRRMDYDFKEFCQIKNKEMEQIVLAQASGNQFFIPAAESSDRLREVLIADFEALYESCANLLEQWAIIVTRVVGIGKKTFHQLVENFMKVGSSSSPLWTQLSSAMEHDIVWVHSHVKIFRDDFVVHFEKPWQQSTIHNCDAGLLQLNFLISPDWYGQSKRKQKDELILLINSRAPEVVRTDSQLYPGTNYILSKLAEHIDLLSDDDRADVFKLVKELGFGSPTFQMLGERMLQFIERSIEILRTFAQTNRSSLNTGQGG